jgi:hypothetical protein
MRIENKPKRTERRKRRNKERPSEQVHSWLIPESCFRALLHIIRNNETWGRRGERHTLCQAAKRCQQSRNNPHAFCGRPDRLCAHLTVHFESRGTSTSHDRAVVVIPNTIAPILALKISRSNFRQKQFKMPPQPRPPTMLETSVKRIVRGLNHVWTDILIALRFYNEEGAGRAIIRPNTSV